MGAAVQVSGFTTEIGQAHIERDEVRVTGARVVVPACPLSLNGTRAFAFQTGVQVCDQGGVVLDDEDPGR